MLYCQMYRSSNVVLYACFILITMHLGFTDLLESLLSVVWVLLLIAFSSDSFHSGQEYVLQRPECFTKCTPRPLTGWEPVLYKISRLRELITAHCVYCWSRLLWHVLLYNKNPEAWDNGKSCLPLPMFASWLQAKLWWIT